MVSSAGAVLQEIGVLCKELQRVQTLAECMSNLCGGRFTGRGFTVHLGRRLGESGICEAGLAAALTTEKLLFTEQALWCSGQPCTEGSSP